MVKSFLILPHLKIQNANALSSPFTIGFPSMTAWTGIMHALNRKINKEFPSVKMKRLGIVSHSFKLQTHKEGFVHSIIGTRKPLDKNGKKWEQPPFIPEARCHLDISLILDMEGVSSLGEDENTFRKDVFNSLHTMKIASGDLVSLNYPQICWRNDETEERKSLRQLMPGYALIERRDLMIKAMKEGKDALEALLDGVRVQSRSEVDEKSKKVSWSKKRIHPGWIVPICTGLHGISNVVKPGKTSNQRDPTVPHRFAESVVTLGEFRMVYRFNNVEELLWEYDYNKNKNLYLCKNHI